MGYSIYFKANFSIKKDEVVLPSEISELFGDSSSSVMVSSLIFSLDGWEISEKFDRHRPDGTDEIDIDELKKFLSRKTDEWEIEDTILTQLDKISDKGGFITFFESY